MILHLTVFASILACAAAAQAPAPGGAAQKAAPTTSAADRRARDMRDQVSEGRLLKSHVKVRVRLNNGSRLSGVVKDGRLVERVDGLHFVRAVAEDRGAGVRLYYTSGTRGFVFVPFDSVKSYEVLQRLSQQQVQQIESEMQRGEQRAVERRARAAELAAVSPERPASPPVAAAATPRPLRNPPPGPDGLAGWQPTRPSEPASQPETARPSTAAPSSAEPASSAESAQRGDAAPRAAKRAAVEASEPATRDESEQSEEQLRWSALLRQFPPKQGWNEAKRDEISRRFVVLGAQPSAVEKAFVAQFEDWLKACSFYDVDPNAGVVPTPQTRREQRRAEHARTRPRRK